MRPPNSDLPGIAAGGATVRQSSGGGALRCPGSARALACSSTRPRVEHPRPQSHRFNGSVCRPRINRLSRNHAVRLLEDDWRYMHLLAGLASSTFLLAVTINAARGLYKNVRREARRTARGGACAPPASAETRLESQREYRQSPAIPNFHFIPAEARLQ